MAKNTSENYFEKLEKEVQTNQSKISMVLGALIVLVIGILIFNYFSKSKSDLGPAQQTKAEENNYTVKEGDTLFTIADKFYQNGYLYTEIAKANNLADADQIETGQVLQIPKVTTTETTTLWGPKIEGNTYTVVEGDWLSTIAGRAYGDIMAFDKIAKANNIPNPDLIEPGTVLTIPR